MKDFKGKTAVVTGAASGIGYALAEAFAAQGMQVVLADIEETKLNAAVEKLRESGATAIGVVANAMVEDSVQALAERSIKEFGKVHILCNNAGVTSSAAGMVPIWEVKQKDWDWVLGVNLNGVIYGLRAFVPHMVEHGEPGHIVNTSSGAAMLPGQGPYGVSKHGVLCLTENLYLDLKARNLAIGASVLCPGIVNTNIVEAERNRPAEFDIGAQGLAQELVDMGKEMLASGKQPAEVADIVLDSIRSDSLYILPNPAWDTLFKQRVDNIINRQSPLIVDQLDIMKRCAAGEPF